MSKVTFPSVLKKHGFKRIKQHHKGIVPYQLGSDPKTSIYSENYTDGSQFLWIVGSGIKNNSRYPGGQHFWEPEKLDELLTELLKSKTNGKD